jgi:pimeloyl-ACP methyl ester carboxylesterase
MIIMNAFEFPPQFRTREIATNGTSIYVRSGGNGPAVVLLHGYGETGDMWAPMAVDLARDHTVVVPDLRGMGLSSKPAGGFDKKTQAGDVAGVLDELKISRADLVTHDIGNMVGYAFAAQHPHRVARFVLIDAPLPGIGPWEEILKNPLLWHFRFGGPDMERLVAGRERIYLDRFWNEFSATPARFTEGVHALFQALRDARCNAFRFHAVRRVRPRCYRQPEIFSQRQTSNACIGDRRREIVWRDHG